MASLTAELDNQPSALNTLSLDAVPEEIITISLPNYQLTQKKKLLLLSNLYKSILESDKTATSITVNPDSIINNNTRQTTKIAKNNLEICYITNLVLKDFLNIYGQNNNQKIDAINSKYPSGFKEDPEPLTEKNLECIAEMFGEQYAKFIDKSYFTCIGIMLFHNYCDINPLFHLSAAHLGNICLRITKIVDDLDTYLDDGDIDLKVRKEKMILVVDLIAKLGQDRIKVVLDDYIKVIGDQISKEDITKFLTELESNGIKAIKDTLVGLNNYRKEKSEGGELDSDDEEDIKNFYNSTSPKYMFLRQVYYYVKLLDFSDLNKIVSHLKDLYPEEKKEEKKEDKKQEESEEESEEESDEE